MRASTPLASVATAEYGSGHSRSSVCLFPWPVRVLFAHEAWRLLALAIPLIAAQLAAIGMGTVDTMMAGHFSRQGLAAVALGTNVNVPLFVFSLGLCMAVSPIVAHHRGARRDPRELGPVLRHALLVSQVVGLRGGRCCNGRRRFS